MFHVLQDILSQVVFLADMVNWSISRASKICFLFCQIRGMSVLTCVWIWKRFILTMFLIRLHLVFWFFQDLYQSRILIIIMKIWLIMQVFDLKKYLIWIEFSTVEFIIIKIFIFITDLINQDLPSTLLNIDLMHFFEVHLLSTPSSTELSS